MLCDALTKMTVPSDLLHFVLRNVQFTLVKETHALEWKAQERRLKEKTTSRRRGR